MWKSVRQKIAEAGLMLKTSPFREVKIASSPPVPKTITEFTRPEAYHVWSNSRYWRKKGIGVA